MSEEIEDQSEKQTVHLNVQQLLDIIERLTFTNWMLTRTPKWQPTHRHYKGKLYRLISIGMHTETHELLATYDNKNGEVFHRPVDMFYGTLGVEKVIRRFEPIEVKDVVETVSTTTKENHDL